MAYWKRWRRNHADALAQAMYTISSESEGNVPEDVMIDSAIATADLSTVSPSETEYSEPPKCYTSSSEHEAYYDESVDAQPQSVDKRLSASAVHHQITRTAAGDLPVILRDAKLPLPKDERTILNTSRHVLSMEKCGGQYRYTGLQKGIQSTMDKVTYEGDTLYLDIM